MTPIQSNEPARPSFAAGQSAAPAGDRTARLWLYRLLSERSRLWARFLHQSDRLRRLPRRARRQIGRRVAFGLAGVALALTLSNVSAGATITVDNNQVNIVENNKCSLREAIINANTNSQIYDDCVGGNGNDIISLPSGGVFTINNSYTDFYGPTGLPPILSTLTIQGHGATISRATNAPNFRLLGVAPGGDLSLFHLTLQRGKAPNADGGAIYVADSDLLINEVTIEDSVATGDGNGGAIATYFGTVTLRASTISDNSAGGAGGGIFSTTDLSDHPDGGTVEVAYSTISGNSAGGGGGGIAMAANGFDPGYTDFLDVGHSTISANTANAGGGIHLDRGRGLAEIKASTISGNSAATEGGGLFAGLPTTTDVYIVNSTFSGNSAEDGGGLKNQQANISIFSSTVTGNNATDRGGGLYRFGGGNVYLGQSIVSGNSAPIGPETYSEGAGYVNSFYTIFGHSGNAGTIANDGTDPLGLFDIVPTQPLAQILDPTLQNLGGWTAVHALVAGSPALDSLDESFCTFAPVNGKDQRDKNRNVNIVPPDANNDCDIGAFERQLSQIVISPNTAALLLQYLGGNQSEFFNGPRAGLPDSARIDATDVPDHDGATAHLSFDKTTAVPGLGRVPAQDVVTYDGRGFAFLLDGSDVGLSTAGENVDALSVLDGAFSPVGQECRAYLLVSTQGGGSVTGADGRAVRFRGEDVLGFCAQETGAVTRGVWHLAFDGSAEGLPAGVLTNLAALDNGRAFFFMTSKAFRADGVAGQSGQIYRFDSDTGLITGPYWATSDVGLRETVSGLSVAGDLLLENRR